MISPYEAREYIDNSGAPRGQNVALPDDVDTSQCQEFFGTRCPHNVHVKGSRLAHVDRVDPRRNPLGHLKHDVRVPYAVMGGLGGAAVGGLVNKNDRKKGAAVGSLVGFGVGLIMDAIADQNSAQDRQYEDQYI